ncbi:hypothetical protein CF336_g5199 [Tilletia laevis]|uniref:Uncharacterized protein n=1 Tax=Tilletia caries TaxID=13290 RepID=A0A177V7A2_9BASI|nr:hypothetical protein CF336_g5199 [Tilletia laevis]KAE8262767.1 hypothetical protein A4X03_0g2197 [Tilletia caries]
MVSVSTLLKVITLALMAQLSRAQPARAEKRVSMPWGWILPSAAVTGAIEHYGFEGPARMEEPRLDRPPPRTPETAPTPAPPPPQQGVVAPPNSPINSPPQSPPRLPIDVRPSFMEVIEAHAPRLAAQLRM